EKSLENRITAGDRIRRAAGSACIAAGALAPVTYGFIQGYTGGFSEGSEIGALGASLAAMGAGTGLMSTRKDFEEKIKRAEERLMKCRTNDDEYACAVRELQDLEKMKSEGHVIDTVEQTLLVGIPWCGVTYAIGRTLGKLASMIG
ncbi:MAG: hypothetical protein V1734_00055, partial [Nanoarchaeota archaeon]